MYSKIIIGSLFFCMTFGACKDSKQEITNPDDYNHFLEFEDSFSASAREEHSFWTKKLEMAPTQFPYLNQIANANTQLFETTGNIEYLIEAEKELVELNSKTNYNNAASLRALARNYITQHRFKESLTLLQKAEENGENLLSTKKVLFDVHLELGDYDKAEAYLAGFQDFNNFDYLIRLSKWNDHIGDLEEAIHLMEKALAIAESSKNPSLQQWTYTNLADYYGHAGRISESYSYYLKALSISPNDAFALKGIAWIVFSYEKNADEAWRILNAISKQHNSPDYFLLKAEIAEFKNDATEKSKNIDAYLQAVQNETYGDMYNKYIVQLFAEEVWNFEAGLELANREISQRPTPQSYDLLAWLLFKNGEHQKALNIMENFVANQSFEPEIQYHLAEIYKANGKLKEVQKIKKELLSSIFELGPNMEQKIQLL